MDKYVTDSFQNWIDKITLAYVQAHYDVASMTAEEFIMEEQINIANAIKKNEKEEYPAIHRLQL